MWNTLHGECLTADSIVTLMFHLYLFKITDNTLYINSRPNWWRV